MLKSEQNASIAKKDTGSEVKSLESRFLVAGYMLIAMLGRYAFS